MQQFTHIVKSKMGMHMRPAMEIFHLAHRHKSNIQMTCNGKMLHAKMGMRSCFRSPVKMKKK